MRLKNVWIFTSNTWSNKYIKLKNIHDSIQLGPEVSLSLVTLNARFHYSASFSFLCRIGAAAAGSASVSARIAIVPTKHKYPRAVNPVPTANDSTTHKVVNVDSPSQVKQGFSNRVFYGTSRGNSSYCTRGRLWRCSKPVGIISIISSKFIQLESSCTSG